MTEQRKSEHGRNRGATSRGDGGDRGGRPGEHDPHGRLNRPVDDIEREAEHDAGVRLHPTNDVAGMGRGGGSSEGPDPMLPEGSRADREERSPGQSTPFGEPDAEADAVRRAEEATGVPLEEES